MAGRSRHLRTLLLQSALLCSCVRPYSGITSADGRVIRGRMKRVVLFFASPSPSRVGSLLTLMSPMLPCIGCMCGTNSLVYVWYVFFLVPGKRAQFLLRLELALRKLLLESSLFFGSLFVSSVPFSWSTLTM